MTPGIQELMRQVERVVDTYRHDVFVARDVDAAMAAIAPASTLVNVPMTTGARDHDGVRRYLADAVLPHLPDDLDQRRVSRTVDRFRVVDELVVSFTHDRELPWLLPGVPPTGRAAQVMAISVVSVRQGRISAQRTLWDLAGLLARLDLPANAVAVGDVVDFSRADSPASLW